MDTNTWPQVLVTLDYLRTLPGLIVMTYLMTYFFKYPIKALYKKIFKANPGKMLVPFLAAFIAFGINIWMLVVLKDISVLTLGLGLFNAFVAAFAAFISHDFIKGKNKESETYNETYELEPIIQTANIDTPEEFATKVAAAMKAGDRGEEPPSTI